MLFDSAVLGALELAFGSSRRSATVHMAVPDACSAAARISWLAKPPVPRIRREGSSRPAMTNGSSMLSSSLNRTDDLYPVAVSE